MMPQRAMCEQQGRFALGLRLSFEQIGKPLCLSQVNATILKGPACELSRRGGAKPFQFAKRAEDCVDDCPTAMAMQLDDILTGGAGGPVETQN
jgi:hypothetical protein